VSDYIEMVGGICLTPRFVILEVSPLDSIPTKVTGILVSPLPDTCEKKLTIQLETTSPSSSFKVSRTTVVYWNTADE
jgi:hypothetical protein